MSRFQFKIEAAEISHRLAMEWGLFVYHGPEECRDDPDVEPCNDDCKACAFERHPAVRRALGEIGSGE